MMYEKINTYADSLIAEFDTIPEQRKNILKKIVEYISLKKKEQLAIKLVYICTHNSRRSHFGQIWASVAASYYKVEDIYTFSGGTEVTAFHANSIRALKRIGFHILAEEAKNPICEVTYDDQLKPITCFSKVYNHSFNPSTAFAAIMTCSEAEENCPFIPGAEFRTTTPYDDPKAFDDTILQDVKYDERCKQIALETFYIFSKINPS